MTRHDWRPVTAYAFRPQVTFTCARCGLRFTAGVRWDGRCTLVEKEST
ncbi:hypothetical protein [Deinococcus phoenicis]|nr:hypothetical protein [Deinococcus phoenicis]